MSDLISRSELLKHSRKVTEYDEAGYSRVYRAVSVEDIKYQPIAYDVDKVVKELEEQYGVKKYEDDVLVAYEQAYIHIDEAIEIVKGGGVNERD